MLIKSALVARGTFVLCEYDASTAGDDLTEVSRKVLSKIPRTGSIRSYMYGGHTFNYLVEKDLLFLCIAVDSAGRELVFQFLEEFRESFDKHSRIAGPNRGAELTRTLRDLIMQYNEGSTTKVKQMQQELDDVTDMMRDNLGKVMERGERLESLIDKTHELSSDSTAFRSGAKRYNDTLWWRDQRGRMMLGLVVVAVIVVASWCYLGSLHSKAHAAAAAAMVADGADG
mmetsp:Transcript_109348/g.316057  ORF Transcript_109348/g.316057 Transcript_109348/m.316057 type:complete len:228 (-) Transcript_109348:18-701(-)